MLFVHYKNLTISRSPLPARSIISLLLLLMHACLSLWENMIVYFYTAFLFAPIHPIIADHSVRVAPVQQAIIPVQHAVPSFPSLHSGPSGLSGQEHSSASTCSDSPNLGRHSRATLRFFVVSRPLKHLSIYF